MIGAVIGSIFIGGFLLLMLLWLSLSVQEERMSGVDGFLKHITHLKDVPSNVRPYDWHECLHKRGIEH